MKQINKKQARKLFNEGKPFWMSACNMRPEAGVLINGDPRTPTPISRSCITHSASITVMRNVDVTRDFTWRVNPSFFIKVMLNKFPGPFT